MIDVRALVGAACIALGVPPGLAALAREFLLYFTGRTAMIGRARSTAVNDGGGNPT
jgi:hypothetical protein